MTRSASPSSRPAFLAALLAAAFLLQVGAGARVQSGTCDELGAHLPAGILHWKTGRPTGGLANPPLGQLLVAAGPVVTGTADHPLRDGPRDLLPARIPSVLLGLVTVATTGLLAARAAGTTAGFAAAGAAALCPDIVAHSALATLDLPVTAFTALATLLAWRWFDERSNRSLVGFAVAISTAAMIKASALHSLGAIAVGAVFADSPTPKRWMRAVMLFAIGFWFVAGSAWVLYGPGPAELAMPRTFVDGLQDKLGQGARGHFSYLLGERSPDGFAHYYLVALAVKLPIALQLCLLLGAVWLIRNRASPSVRAFVAFGVFPALWILANMSLVHRVHVGVRHILPAYPALLALAGAGWAWLARSGRLGLGLATVAALWCVAAAAHIAPDSLAYFQELCGGPDRGDEILIDSNLDWGQAEGRFRARARGRTIAVNPPFPTTGLVAANVNAIHGILSADDLRLRWLRRLTPVRTFGHTFRVYEVDEVPLRQAAERDSVAALDYAWWLAGVGRPRDASDVLRRVEATGLPMDASHAKSYWRVRGEVALALRHWSDALDAAERAGDPDLLGEVEHRRRLAQGARAGLAESARAVRALARRGHRAEASTLGREIFGVDPLAALPASSEVSWTEAGRLKALGAERDALEAVGRSLVADPTNADALWLYGELVVRRKLGLTEYVLPDVDWSALAKR